MNKKCCNKCINCVKVSSLHHEVVETECTKGLWNEGFIDECVFYDGGKYDEEMMQEFGSELVGVLSHNQRRKMKAYDYYESEWRK